MTPKTKVLLETLIGASRWLGVREIHFHEASNTVFFVVSDSHRDDRGIAAGMSDFSEFAYRVIPASVLPPPGAIPLLRRRRPRGRPLPA